MRVVTTIEKGIYTTAVHNIYGVWPPPLEENRKAIESFHTIVHGMQTKIYELEGRSKFNEVLTSSN